LNKRIAKKEALELEIRAIEEEIRVTIDPALLPSPSSGILGFPLTTVSLKSCWDGGENFKNCLTQFFGNTAFATGNPQVYSGRGHNGVDFRAGTGEEVFASYDGQIRAVGNTDDQCRGVSYGRWILIDHPNNLSTLYAHLSRSVVTPGAQVKKGERIGYTGQTGYATGPHLHYAVFASLAVQITSLTPGNQYYYKSRICGTPLYLPISPQNGYLNPLSYL
ncbi:MAG: M23 family metallopeptidase, partial [Patescibacteria group bacterium]